jgi:hypothetical protein
LQAARTNVTSRGVPYVRHCPRLVELDLESTEVDDSCVVHVALLKQLNSLNLSSTKVSEEGLEKLVDHPTLRQLSVDNTLLTREGFTRLKARLNDCSIFYTAASTIHPIPSPEGGGFAIETQQLDSASEPLPERELTSDELSFYFEQSHILISKRPHTPRPADGDFQQHARQRVSAARSIAKRLRHVCVVPVLAAVLRDESEDPMLRGHAAGALAYVRSPCAVEVLIETLPQGGYSGAAAERALASLTNVAVGRKKGEEIDSNPSPEEGTHRQELWRFWWDRHRSSIKLHGDPHIHRGHLSEEEWQAQRTQELPPNSSHNELVQPRRQLSERAVTVEDLEPLSEQPQIALREKPSVPATAAHTAECSTHDRKLTQEELALLIEKSNVLMRKPNPKDFTSKTRLDQFNVNRRRAADKLGLPLGHRAAIPALAAVLRDEGDDPEVRCAAATALAYIADPLSVEILIDTIDEGDNVGNSAEWALILMMAVGVGRTPEDRFGESPLEKRLERQQKWRTWWAKNKDRFVLQGAIGSVETYLTEEEWEAQFGSKESPALPPPTEE